MSIILLTIRVFENLCVLWMYILYFYNVNAIFIYYILSVLFAWWPYGIIGTIVMLHHGIMVVVLSYSA